MKQNLKEYESYINKITVDRSLHNRIIINIKKSNKRRHIFRYPKVITFACAIGVILGIIAISNLIIMPFGIKNPISNAINPHEIKGENKLYFNPMNIALDIGNKINILGYFTEELSKTQCDILLGNRTDIFEKSYTLSASAGFSGEGELDEASILCIEKKTGLNMRIQMRKAPIQIGYQSSNASILSYIDDIAVTAGFIDNTSNNGINLYFTSFTLGQTGYYIEAEGGDNAKEELMTLTSLLIKNGIVDLTKITPTSIPEWVDSDLTIEEARLDSDFGSYVPKNIPSGYIFESSKRIISQNTNTLLITWINGSKYIEYSVMRLKNEDKTRIVDINKQETYDLALYPIPRADSIPRELIEIVDNPIFNEKDLTTNTVYTRAYKSNETGDDISGYRMCFSVLYDDVVVKVNVKGSTPEAIFNMLKSAR